MTTEPLVIPKSAYNVLRRLTGESRPEVALSLALKDLVRLRREAAVSKVERYEKKYGASLAEFQASREAGRVSKAHSFEVERDEWEWEAAMTDLAALEDLAEWLV